MKSRKDSLPFPASLQGQGRIFFFFLTFSSPNMYWSAGQIRISDYYSYLDCRGLYFVYTFVQSWPLGASMLQTTTTTSWEGLRSPFTATRSWSWEIRPGHLERETITGSSRGKVMEESSFYMNRRCITVLVTALITPGITIIAGQTIVVTLLVWTPSTNRQSCY